MRALRAVTAFVTALAFTSPSTAHHSPSLVDLRTEVTHVYFHLQVTDDPALEGEWEIEAQSPRIMGLFGWSPTFERRFGTKRRPVADDVIWMAVRRECR